MTEEEIIDKAWKSAMGKMADYWEAGYGKSIVALRKKAFSDIIKQAMKEARREAQRGN